MRPLRWMAALMAAGAASVLILGRLPMLETQMKEGRAAAVSARHAPVILSDDNLVDALGTLRLHHRLKRVGWDHSILAVDILLTDRPDAPSAMAEDLAAFLRFSFEETENVRQALIRVYRPAGGRMELLLYGDPRREDWAMAQKIPQATAPDGAGWRGLLEAYRLKATAAGERWLQVVANS